MSDMAVPDDLAFLQVLMLENELYSHPRLFGDGRWACVAPSVYSCAIIVGRVGNHESFDDRWCYHDHRAACVALDAWNGVGEPQGWYRQSMTGRRLAETDNCYDETGKIVPVGTIYVRH